MFIGPKSKSYNISQGALYQTAKANDITDYELLWDKTKTLQWKYDTGEDMPGAYRQELSDLKAQFNPNNFVVTNSLDKQEKYQVTLDELISDGYFTKDMNLGYDKEIYGYKTRNGIMTTTKDPYGGRGIPYKFATTLDTKLSDILDHEELYKAYPKLRNLRIKFSNDVQDDTLTTYGYYSPYVPTTESEIAKHVKQAYDQKNEDSITLNLNTFAINREEALNTILHEVQHKINMIEVGTPSYYTNNRSAMNEEMLAREVEFRFRNPHTMSSAPFVKGWNTEPEFNVPLTNGLMSLFENKNAFNEKLNSYRKTDLQFALSDMDEDWQDNALITYLMPDKIYLEKYAPFLSYEEKKKYLQDSVNDFKENPLNAIKKQEQRLPTIVFRKMETSMPQQIETENKQDMSTDSDFLNTLKDLENSRKEGWDGEHWKPHTSVEGGRKTIAWGHKLTPEESEGNYILLNNEKISLDTGLTLEQADQLLQQDWFIAQEGAMKFINQKGDFDKLTKAQQLAAIELFFNLGASKANAYTSFRDKVIANDSTWIDEIDRGYTDKTGKYRKLTTRTDKIKKALL